MRVLLWLLLSLLSATPPESGAAPGAAAWALPLTEGTVVALYRAPAHEYGPGHRGIDIAASADRTVRAPTGGRIAFAGRVAGRGVVTIETAEGLVITLEPVDGAPAAGTSLARGEGVGVLGVGGHAAPGTLHVGLRRDATYLDPLPWFRQRERAVLMPCCAASG